MDRLYTLGAQAQGKARNLAIWNKMETRTETRTTLMWHATPA
jgi:hypothetical protein